MYILANIWYTASSIKPIFCIILVQTTLCKEADGKNLALPNAIFTGPVEEELAFSAAFADGRNIHAVPKTHLKASGWGSQIGTTGLRHFHAF